MNFLDNIKNLTPPTMNEIELEINKERVLRKALLFLVVLSLAVMITSLLMSVDFVVGVLLIAYAFSCAFVYFAIKSADRERLLMPADFDEYSDLDAILKNEEISRYIKKVVNIGRELTGGEIEALRIALYDAKERAKQREDDIKLEEKIMKVYEASPSLRDRLAEKLGSNDTNY